MKKKLISAVLSAVLIASSVLAGCGQGNTAGNDSNNTVKTEENSGTSKTGAGERTKITALLKGTESTEQFLVFDYLLKNFCADKGLDYEIELVQHCINF